MRIEQPEIWLGETAQQADAVGTGGGVAKTRCVYALCSYQVGAARQKVRKTAGGPVKKNFGAEAATARRPRAKAQQRSSSGETQRRGRGARGEQEAQQLLKTGAKTGKIQRAELPVYVKSSKQSRGWGRVDRRFLLGSQCHFSCLLRGHRACGLDTRFFIIRKRACWVLGRAAALFARGVHASGGEANGVSSLHRANHAESVAANVFQLIYMGGADLQLRGA
jgi:hypothetical protein